MKISCIVPVYNEWERVDSVLSVLVGHKLIDEVIVVNDGSTDNSEEILKKVQGINLISYPKNSGKSHAVKLGIEAAKNEWIVTVDSDLVGLKSENIEALIMPVEKGIAEMSMTLRKNSLWIFKVFGIDFVSGERVFSKKIIGDLAQMDQLPGFGLETFLNEIIVRSKMKIAVVDWVNVITPRKSVKFGVCAGVKGDFKMVLQIISVVGFFGMIRQFFKMRALKV